MQGSANRGDCATTLDMHVQNPFLVSSHLVYKEVLAAPLCTLGLDEAEAFARIEPPYGASSPLRLPFRSALRSAGARDSQLQLLDLLGDLILLILRVSHVRGNLTQCRAIGANAFRQIFRLGWVGPRA